MILVIFHINSHSNDMNKNHTDIFVIGGLDESDQPVDTVHRYNTIANEWDTMAPISDVN